MHRELKSQAMRLLRSQGKRIRDGASMDEIVRVICGKSLGSGLTEYIAAWVASQPGLPPPAVAAPPEINRMVRGDFHWRHPRATDIDRGQPPMITPNGIGNVKQPGGFIPVVDRW